MASELIITQLAKDGINVFDIACGDTSYEGPSGIINSPNYPGNYSNNQNCDYRLNVSTIASLSFVFKSFNTQEGFDFVTVSRS